MISTMSFNRVKLAIFATSGILGALFLVLHLNRDAGLFGINDELRSGLDLGRVRYEALAWKDMMLPWEQVQLHLSSV